IIVRMHNGEWAIIFGNGLDSGKSAGIYIGLIDTSDGSVDFKFLDTGVSSDGIAYVSQADLDGDVIADYLYAGDTQGNVWRFDVTSSDESEWHVSKFGHDNPTPLFVAKDGGSRQPITTAITVLSVKTGTVTRDMLYFGTGRFRPKTETHGGEYASGTQTFYGIWDWDMSSWNSGSATEYASLSDTQEIERDDLLAQTVVTKSLQSNGTEKGYRTLSKNKEVCWKDGKGASSTCSDHDQYGWRFDLPGNNEQIIYNPTFV